MLHCQHVEASRLWRPTTILMFLMFIVSHPRPPLHRTSPASKPKPCNTAIPVFARPCLGSAKEHWAEGSRRRFPGRDLPVCPDLSWLRIICGRIHKDILVFREYFIFQELFYPSTSVRQQLLKVVAKYVAPLFGENFRPHLQIKCIVFRRGY